MMHHTGSVPTVIHGDYEWDSDKAEQNLRKHGVSFEEAAAALDDPHEIAFADSADAANALSLVMSPAARVLLVVSTARADRTRIISARKAEPHEQRAYDQARS
jgi:uncharacterized DUF497 family protein